MFLKYKKQTVHARRLKPGGSLPYQFDIKETPAVKRELILLMLRHAFLITLISRMKENKMVSNKAILIADIDKPIDSKNLLGVLISLITRLKAGKLSDALSEVYLGQYSL